MENVNENASLDFKSLKKRGVEKNNKEVESCESFIYDGVKYMLYDCVYMYNEGLGGPYIGKLTRIWELPDKTKKVKVHWFFRPEQISKWLGETKTLENEIIFATGEGPGLANINPLEAIIGLCNVVCLSKDSRNPQPSDEQLKAADFVFYRTFDVQRRVILDKMDDKVGGIEIKYVFNREESEKTRPFLESTSDTKEEDPIIFTSSGTQQLVTEVLPHKPRDDAKGEPQNNDIHNLLERETNFTESDKSHGQPSKKLKYDDTCLDPGVARGFEKMSDTSSVKSMVGKADNGEMKVGMVPVEQLENKERNKTPTGSDKLYDQPFKKSKPDDKKLPEEKRVRLEVAHDSERFKEISSKKLTVDSRSKHEEKSPADVNSLEASETCGPTGDRKNSTFSAKVTSDDLEGETLKKTRDDGSFKVPDKKTGINKNVRDMVELSKRKSNSGIVLDILGNNNYNKKAKVEQSGESKKELSMNKLLKVSAFSTDKDKNDTFRGFVVGPMPNAETSNWFKRLPWEEDRLEKAYGQGTAILLHNMDPEYNSGEVERIIWHAFKEKCDAKILQHTSGSSPHYAQALVLLKTKEAAQRVLTKLDEKCLMLSNGSQIFMPLVGTPCPPISTKKNSSFFGHLTINKAKFQNQRQAEAVSTSHFSQINTIEYDMAMEWCLLQLTSMKCWEILHEQQRLELENLKNDLKNMCTKIRKLACTGSKLC